MYTGRQGICSEISEPYRSLIPGRLATVTRCCRPTKTKKPKKRKRPKEQRELFAETPQ